MSKLPSKWKTATIANGAKLSNEVDLGDYYDSILVIMPDLTTDNSAAIQVAKGSGGTFVNLQSGGSDVALPKSKATVVSIAGAKFLKISCATNQGTQREIQIRGI